MLFLPHIHIVIAKKKIKNKKYFSASIIINIVKCLVILKIYCIFAPALLLSNTSKQVLYISRFMDKGCFNRMKVPKPTVKNKGYTEGQR